MLIKSMNPNEKYNENIYQKENYAVLKLQKLFTLIMILELICFAECFFHKRNETFYLMLPLCNLFLGGLKS